MKNRWALICLTGASCTLHPSDCLFFGAGCEPFRPQGLVCGLAHSGDDHIGGSCHLEYDPAMSVPTSGVVSAGRTDAPCPAGYESQHIADHSSAGHGWDYCIAAGNRPRSSAHLRDIPAGAACGLSHSRGQPRVACDGEYPADGTCPPGYRFRWLPDRHYDRVDAQCNPDPTQDWDLNFNQVNVLPFCEVLPPPPGLDEDDPSYRQYGCTADNCPAYAEVDGVLCGLHARGDFFLSADDGSTLEMTPLTDIIRDWIAPCAPFQDDLARLLPDLLQAALDPPMCMGQDISSGQCPAGMILTCTSDGLTDDFESYLSGHICWCGVPGSAQQLAPDTGS